MLYTQPTPKLPSPLEQCVSGIQQDSFLENSKHHCFSGATLSRPFHTWPCAQLSGPAPAPGLHSPWSLRVVSAAVMVVAPSSSASTLPNIPVSAQNHHHHQRPVAPQHPHQAHCPATSWSRPMDAVGVAAPSSISSQTVSFLPPLPSLSPMCTCLWWQHSQS